MRKESSEQPPPEPQDSVEFTEQEKLFDRISHERFMNWIEDEATTVHKAELSSNSFGEFLFVTTSRPSQQGSANITFWGMGFHEQRERWLTDEWRWYEATPNTETEAQTLSKQEAQRILQEREEEIKPYLAETTQSRRGQLFEMLADLTDEDGAMAEMEDLGYLLDDLDDPQSQ